MTTLPSCLSGIAAKSYATRDAWLEGRRESVGASEVAALFGASPWTSAYALWHQKRAPAPERVAPDYSTEHAQRLLFGTVLEPAMAQAYATITGRALEDIGELTVLYDAASPLTCTLDYVVMGDGNGRGPGCLELKNVSAPAYGRAWADGIPLHYQLQVQAQMAVTGMPWASIGAVVGGCRLEVYDVDADRDLHALIREAAREFVARVRDGQPPDPDGSGATREALRSRFPAAIDGKTVVFGDDARAGWEERRTLKAEIAEREARVAEIEHRILAVLGDAEIGIIPGVGRMSYKNQPERVVESYVAKAHRRAYWPAHADPVKAARLIEEVMR